MKKLHNVNEFEKEEANYAHFSGEISPAFSNRNVAISIVASNEYSPYAAVLVESIIRNANEFFNYDIIILSNDISLHNQFLIKNLGNGKDNISIRFYEISDLVKGFNLFTWGNFTANTYYRLLIPDIFIRYDKIIYLDSDIVVNHDISELFSMDIEGFYLGAAFDTHVVSYCSQEPPLEQLEYNKKVLKLSNPFEYYQMGVALYNIRAINSDFDEYYLIKEAQAHKLRWMDQDLINMLFQGKILKLPNRWNVMVANIPENIDEYHLPKDLRKEYYEARVDPFIIHYIGGAIPCLRTNPDLFEYFWEYARLTPFYELLLQKIAPAYTWEWWSYMRNQRSFTGRIKGFIRKIINKLLPIGSKRRSMAKRVKSIISRSEF